jgi:hypothetical protein
MVASLAHSRPSRMMRNGNAKIHQRCRGSAPKQRTVTRVAGCFEPPLSCSKGGSATLREQVAAERARAEREAAKVAAASAEGEAKGLRLALEEARRPFWRRWWGP